MTRMLPYFHLPALIIIISSSVICFILIKTFFLPSLIHLTLLAAILFPEDFALSLTLMVTHVLQGSILAFRQRCANACLI